MHAAATSKQQGASPHVTRRMLAPGAEGLRSPAVMRRAALLLLVPLACLAAAACRDTHFFCGLCGSADRPHLHRHPPRRPRRPLRLRGRLDAEPGPPGPRGHRLRQRLQPLSADPARARLDAHGPAAPRHGVRDNLGFRLAAEHRTLASRFKAAGLRTGERRVGLRAALGDRHRAGIRLLRRPNRSGGRHGVDGQPAARRVGGGGVAGALGGRAGRRPVASPSSISTSRTPPTRRPSATAAIPGPTTATWRTRTSWSGGSWTA